MKIDYENKTDTLSFKVELAIIIFYILIGLFIGIYSYYSWLRYDLLLSIAAGIFWPITLMIYAVISGVQYAWNWLSGLF